MARAILPELLRSERFSEEWDRAGIFMPRNGATLSSDVAGIAPMIAWVDGVNTQSAEKIRDLGHPRHRIPVTPLDKQG